jgi:TonB-linked SusC/RagA family outer membrane protein
VAARYPAPHNLGFRSLLVFVFVAFAAQLSAQNREISGVVYSSEDSVSLPGVSLFVVGTTVGTSTGMDGEFTLGIPETAESIMVSFVGFKNQTVAVGSGTKIKIYLAPDVEQLDEFVITAFGISREKKALGYAVTEIDVDDMTTAREANLVNTLSGKAAGVQVTKTSGGPGASSRIVIRGNGSLSGNNQPLFVVDGVPIDNTTNGSGGMWGGVDYGSAVSDINPDDIESMTVLKGPNAAALYGSRASNGVIVITTKKGSSRNGVGVSFNSTSSFEFADIQKKFQNEYGAGTGGKFEYNSDGVPFFNTALEADSWGPRMEGQTYVDWDGVTRTYSPQPDNYKDYFELGHTLTNSVSLNGGSDKSTFRLSYTNLKNKGTTPNAKYDRHALTFRAGAQMSERLSADAKINYVRQEAKNRLNQSDGRGAGRNYNFMPRNISDESLRDYQDDAGAEKVWYTPWAWQSNPYWVANENLNQDSRDRVISAFSLNFKIAEWLSVIGRTGLDFYNERRESRTGTGAYANPTGDFSTSWIGFREQNSDFLFTAQKKINDDFDISGNVGGNRMYRFYEQTSDQVGRLSVPDFYHPEYGEDPATSSYFESEKRINSLYAATQLSYKSYLFLDLTGRNDWSSTLPAENNSYFYPSVSVGWVWAEQFELENKWFSFGKIRSSWAQVGGDADPYMLQITYGSNGNFNGNPQVGINGTLPLSNLKPEITTSLEAGTDLRFWIDRIVVDLTVYKANTKNQIVPADVSGATGFSAAVINAGEIENKGIELMITTKPIEGKKFNWESTINWTKNKSTVVSLTEGLDNYLLGEQWGVSIEARPGNPYGDIVGVSIARDGNGSPLMNADGSFVKGDRKVLGNYNPDWMAGFRNTLNYGNFSFGFLIDMKHGGQIYSASNMYAHGYSGTVVETLEGREEWHASEEARENAGVAASGYNSDNTDYIDNWSETGGYSVDGVYAEGTVINGEDVSGQSVSKYVDPESYWGQFSTWGDELHEPHVYDAGFVKLREVSLGYRLPKKAVERLKLTGLTISLVGRNIWLIHSDVPNIDPEATYNNGNGQGVEYGVFPITRSIGFNLKVTL